jgi:hypothetical protein
MAVKPRFNRRKRNLKRKHERFVVKERKASTNAGASCPDFLYYQTGSTVNAYYPWQIAIEKDPLVVMGRYEAGKALRNVQIPQTYGLGNGKEFIKYERGGPLRSNKEYHFCEHVKSQMVNLPYYACRQSANTWYVGDLTRYGRQASPNIVYDPFDWEMLSKAKEQDLGFSARAYRNLLPRFEGDISLINFIWELKDFKNYVKLIFDLDKILYKGASLVNKVNKAIRRATPFIHEGKGGKLSVTEPTKLVAELNLWWQYEVKPTMNDLSDIASQIQSSAASAQAKYIAEGKAGSHHQHKEVVTRNTDVIGTGNNYYLSNGTNYVVKRVADYQFTYDYQVRSGFDLIKHYWGLELTADAVWNMIPGSFLIDYVYGVSKSLHMMRADKNTSNVQGLYGESVKLQQTQGIHLVSDPRVFAYVVDGVFQHRSNMGGRRLIAGLSHTYYKRQLRDPAKYGIAPPRLKVPSRQQFLNISSLARCFF